MTSNIISSNKISLFSNKNSIFDLNILYINKNSHTFYTSEMISCQKKIIVNVKICGESNQICRATQSVSAEIWNALIRDLSIKTVGKYRTATILKMFFFQLLNEIFNSKSRFSRSRPIKFDHF